MNQKDLPFAVKIILSVIVVELVGSAGALVTVQSIDTWYADLVKPPGTPPNWVFGPVWTTLFAMIGTSFALIWRQGFDREGGKTALIFFITQMVLNVLWTPLFFGLHQMLLALVVIVLLWLAILGTIRVFSKRSKLAALLLVPYLLWVSYATYLNAGYWFLNR